MTTKAPNICQEQFCEERVRKGHHLCREHWDQNQAGIIDSCPQCGVFKEAQYDLCKECNQKARRSTPAEAKPAESKQRTGRYKSGKAETFAERSALLEDDPKAEDKQLLFHQQNQLCVYCGNRYRYDELEIEHMIPKALGGPDHIRNAQLACKSCNQAKGTMTDIEFREKHSQYLPQKPRTPANPPVEPALLRARQSRQARGSSNYRGRRS